MKTIALFIAAWVMSIAINAQTISIQKHEVLSGETLYSIARQYHVSVSALLELNPGVEADHIMTGQRLNVPAASKQEKRPVSVPLTTAQSQEVTALRSFNRPQYKAKHEVKKKETIYSLSRLYGVTEEQLINANPDLKKGKLKKGTIINIPYSAEDDAKYLEEQRRLQEEARKAMVKKYPVLKVAIILPFSSLEEKMTLEAQKMTNLYQGFLLAVDSLKQHGYNVEVQAYDEVGKMASIETILKRPELQNVQLIVGPIRQWNIKPVAQFANEKGITHVVPLSNSLSLVDEQPTTFQVNTNYSQMFSQVYNRFSVFHKGHNVVFVNMNDRADNMVYINNFKKEFDARSIKYISVNVTDETALLNVLKSEGVNVLIPTSGSPAAFEILCKKLDGIEIPQGSSVMLFGYPEWQTFSPRYDKWLSRYQCQFYTSFYSNSTSVRTQRFNQLFRRWFNQEQHNSFPKYGELGHDIGAYFLKGLHDYGSAFYENLHSFVSPSIEFPMNFEKKNSKSGYQNKTILFVAYRSDGTVMVR